MTPSLRRAAGVIVFAAWVAFPGAAGAADDAGTQSVFAYGAGNRALAMGGAYVASGDDANALVWNPAGLGLVRRASVEAVQSGDANLDIRESYIALAAPNWRWGTVGLTFRHFGVHGVEHRDDRNVLLGDDLSDAEEELAVGYGRALNTTWAVGGSIKVVHQSLAGLSGSGLGADLGLGVQPGWARGFRFGLAVRNAIEPAVRLDRESVNDPMTLRSGLAYLVPHTGTGGLLAEVDLERPRDGANKLHAGMEYRWLDLAAIRVGMNGEVMTAGSSVRWHGVSVDYAFENAPLANTNRVGLSMGFGHTVDENRAASRRSEDDALERRMVEVFQERQAAQIAGLLAKADSSRAHGLYDDALEGLGVVQTLDPSDTRVAALQSRCLVEKASRLENAGDYSGAAVTFEMAHASDPSDTVSAAGAVRCRQEGDRRAARSAQIRAQFSRAMDALSADDLPEAREGFAGVLQRDPGDADAARMLARTEAVMARRAAQAVDDADRYLRAGMLDEARSAVELANTLDRRAVGLAEVTTALARAKQAVAAGNASGSGDRTGSANPAPVSTLSDREVEQLYQLGLSALKTHRVDEALRYWEHVWAERPGYRQVGDFLKREYLARGMESFAAGRLEDAVAEWQKVLRIDPRDARAQGYLDRAQKQMTRSREILGMSQ
ncbi:MAG: PorV/PorQ family protein [Candidatus Eisenbacteria bacterium]